MKPKSLRLYSDSEGKGIIGCVLSIVILGVIIFLGITLGPIYYSNLTFESDVKTEVARAGARFIDSDALAKNIIDLARRNEIRLTRENIKVERFAGQVHIRINYSVPVDLLVVDRDLNFEIKVSSFVGAI
jgi:hypothetical protein